MTYYSYKYGYYEYSEGYLSGLTLTTELDPDGRYVVMLAPGVSAPAGHSTSTVHVDPATSTADVGKGQAIYYPGTPAVEGTPAEVRYEDALGWNAGARSVATLDGDGFVQFRIPPRPTGLIAGLADADNSPAFNEATHAFYAHGTTIEVVERGRIIATVPVLPASDPLLTIVRESGEVTYVVGEWRLRSETQSIGGVFLDASLYATGDFVDSPRIGPMSALDGYALRGSMDGTAPRMTGEFFQSATPNGRLLGVAPALTGQFVGRALVTLQGVAPAAQGRFGRVDHGELRGSLPPAVGAFDGGFPKIIVSTLDTVTPPLVGAFIGRIGVKGALDGQLRLDGRFAGRPYAAMQGALPFTLAGHFSEGPPPGTYGVMEFLYLFDFVTTDPVVFAEIRETLELGTTMVLTLVLEAGFMDGLLLTDELSLEQLLDAVINDRLALHSGVSTTRQAALQYAVNLATGALTTYQNFDFRGFTRLEDKRTFGWRPDGVYEIGGDTDDGARLNALLDLGATDFETSRKKYVPAVFLGLGTDGCAYLRLTGDDGCERVYRVIQREDISRANPAQGLAAREWHTVLEIADATQVDFDGIEWAVEVTSRRWTR